MLIWKHYAFSSASLILNVHYQLALTYEPVHLSLYVAEQGTRFLWTQSQTSLQCYPQPAAQKQHINGQLLACCFIVLTSSEQTRKWHVTLEPISFMLCLYVRSFPLLALGLVLRIYKGGFYIQKEKKGSESNDAALGLRWRSLNSTKTKAQGRRWHILCWNISQRVVKELRDEAMNVII